MPGLWTTPEPLMGMNPVGVGVGATTLGIFGPGTAPICDGREPRASETGGTG